MQTSSDTAEIAAKLTLHLQADSGYESTAHYRISADQRQAILSVASGKVAHPLIQLPHNPKGLVAELDEDGENWPLRCFLMQYGGNTSHNVLSMRDHMRLCGFDGFWPEWVEHENGHLTKAGAQLWIKFLISLEPK